MPISYYQAIPQILERVLEERPASILDVGAGFGKYGMLLREALELPHSRYHKHQWTITIDGVEVFQDYRNPIHDYVYDRMYYGPIGELIDELPRYDVVLLIDTLGHFTKQAGKVMLEKLMLHASKAVLISTPINPSPQGEYLGNPHETLVSRWSHIDFIGFDSSHQLVHTADGGAQIFKLSPVSKPIAYPSNDAIWEFEPPAPTKEHLTIGYTIPHHGLTGGMKMLLEQIRQLRRKGHRVRAIYRGAEATSLPPWTDVRPDEETVILPDQPLLPHLEGCDVVMAGFFDQLPELAGSPVPVLYWEQGYPILFGDVDIGQAAPYRSWLDGCYKQPVAMAAVSATIAEILDKKFGRKAKVIRNGIDVDAYSPATPPDTGTILMVGYPSRFKGFDIALKALQMVWNIGHRFKVKWICHTPQSLSGISYPIEFISNPPQPELPRLYQQADLFLFASWYEGFGLPPLEAMASGVPVVATNCGGISEYASHGHNSLLAEPGDSQQLAAYIGSLLQDRSLRAYLAANGRETALRFQWNAIADELEQALRVVAAHGRVEKN
jgi:glycosyltransferase involved in cell wall biosynthesis